MIIYSSTSTKSHLAAYIPVVNVVQLDLSHLKVENTVMKQTQLVAKHFFSVWQLGEFSCSAALQRSRKKIRQRGIKFWWVQLYVPDAIACKKSVLAKKDELCQWIAACVQETESVRGRWRVAQKEVMCVRCPLWWHEGFYPHVFDHRFTLQWGNAEPEGVGSPLPNRWGSIGCTHAEPV